MNLSFIISTFIKLLAGVPITLNLALISVLVGMTSALCLTILRLCAIPGMRSLIIGYVFVFRGTPLLVQIFLIYYGLGQFHENLENLHLWYIFREPYFCALLALSLNTAAYGSEIIRGGLQSIPAQQVEAGRACGMSGVLLFRRITLPITIRNIIPIYGNEIILMVKSTSLASTITIMEITGIAAKLISETYRAFEVFAAAGAIYLLINFVFMRAIWIVEYIVSPHLRSRSGGGIVERTDMLTH